MAKKSDKKKKSTKKKKTTKKKSTKKKHTTQKKSAPKRTEHKDEHITINLPEQKESKMDRMLLENFVSLQKVMTNLSTKLDDLTSQVSKLLELFEISAKALAEKDFDIEKNNKEILEKMDSLVDQNKTLARGITLLHEKDHSPQQPSPMNSPTQNFSNRPSTPPPSSPPFPKSTPDFPTNKAPEGFQPSITATQGNMPQGNTKPMSKEIGEGENPETTPRFESPM